jgi:signal transduction histidine kinase
MTKFILADFLERHRTKIIAEWVRQLHTEVSDQYALRPREELQKNIEEAFEAYFHILVRGEFSAINRFIDRIAQMRLEAGFLLSDVQKAFELYGNIVIPLLAQEAAIPSVEAFCEQVMIINRCLAYTIHRFSDHFQDMHERRAMEHFRRIEETRRLVELVQMANRVAHDLRNPLTAVGGFSRRLYNKMADDDPDKKYLAIVVEAVKALEANITKIIKIADEEQTMDQTVREKETKGCGETTA